MFVILFILLTLHIEHQLTWSRKVEKPVRFAVVTGGNKGIGFATIRLLCKAFRGKVILIARNKVYAESAIDRLNNEGCFPLFYQLDLRDRVGCEQFRDYLNETIGGFDVLINNAAIRYNDDCQVSLYRQAKDTLHVNFFSTVYLSKLLFPLLRPHARVVNLSSPCGHVSIIPSEELRKKFDMKVLTFQRLLDLMGDFKRSVAEGENMIEGWGNDSYCISKVALTAFTFIQQRTVTRTRPYDDIIVNCYSPGNVHSALTEYTGTEPPYKVAVNIVNLAILPPYKKKPVGKYLWHNLKAVEWDGKLPEL